MKPPKCHVCGERDCPIAQGLVAFRKTDDDRAWDRRVAETRLTGHPPYAVWFCDAHLPAARAVAHLTKVQALAALGGLRVQRELEALLADPTAALPADLRVAWSDEHTLHGGTTIAVDGGVATQGSVLRPLPPGVSAGREVMVPPEAVRGLLGVLVRERVLCLAPSAHVAAPDETSARVEVRVAGWSHGVSRFARDASTPTYLDGPEPPPTVVAASPPADPLSTVREALTRLFESRAPARAQR